MANDNMQKEVCTCRRWFMPCTMELTSVYKNLILSIKKLEFTKRKLDSTKRRLDSMKRKLDSTKRKLDFTKRKIDSTKRKLEFHETQTWFFWCNLEFHKTKTCFFGHSVQRLWTLWPMWQGIHLPFYPMAFLSDAILSQELGINIISQQKFLICYILNIFTNG